VGAANTTDIARTGGKDALRAMGLEPFDIEGGGTRGEKEVMRRANAILGFQ